MARRAKEKVNIPICAAAVLLCLTLFSAHLTGGIYARYTTSASGSDSARVAKFEVTEAGTVLTDSITADLIPGAEETRTIQVTNNSEVVVKYSVTLTNETGNLPLTVSLAKTGGEAADGADYDVLAIGESAKYTVSLYWPTSPEANRSPEYSGKIDQVRITLTAEQMD